jgi:hypothetical protein
LAIWIVERELITKIVLIASVRSISSSKSPRVASIGFPKSVKMEGDCFGTIAYVGRVELMLKDREVRQGDPRARHRGAVGWT